MLARHDPALRATVVSGTRLLYAEGPDAGLDRPAHVRAGSALAWVGDRLAVVQDDASFLALVEPESGRVDAIALPAGHGGLRQFDDGRGNKADKLDLEACLFVPGEGGGTLLAFGSGSTAARERVVVVRDPAGAAPAVSVADARELYAALRAERAFSGSELNVEGAVLAGEDVLLFQRGNGAPDAKGGPVDATCRLGLGALLRYLENPRAVPRPAPRDVRAYDLGAVEGVRLTFTDAAARASAGGGVLFLAAAEASPDATRDGPVAGVALGLIEPDGSARLTLLRQPGGAPWSAKAEGLAVDPHDPGRVLVVVDADDPAVPSELCRIELDGPW